MKIYATIITIIAILALATVGYGYYTGIKIKKIILEDQKTIQKMQDDDRQKSKEITALSEMLRETTNSLMHAGDLKFSSVNPTSLDKINQNLTDISSSATRQQIQNEWNTFKQTLTLNDYRSFVRTVADTIKNKAEIN